MKVMGRGLSWISWLPRPLSSSNCLWIQRKSSQTSFMTPWLILFWVIRMKSFQLTSRCSRIKPACWLMSRSHSSPVSRTFSLGSPCQTCLWTLVSNLMFPEFHVSKCLCSESSAWSKSGMSQIRKTLTSMCHNSSSQVKRRSRCRSLNFYSRTPTSLKLANTSRSRTLIRLRAQQYWTQ